MAMRLAFSCAMTVWPSRRLSSSWRVLPGWRCRNPNRRKPRNTIGLKRLADALEAACKWFEAQLRVPAGREALAYLIRRGLDDRTIAEFRLGYAPPAGEALRTALIGQGQ